MSTPAFHRVTLWLLIVCVTMHSIVGFGLNAAGAESSGGSSRLAMCIGCPEAGLTIDRPADLHGATITGSCCDDVSAFPGTLERQRVGLLLVNSSPACAETCGCIDISLEIARMSALAHLRVSLDEVVTHHALVGSTLDLFADLAQADLAPALPALPREIAALAPSGQCTLLSLRTSLVL